MSDQVKATVSPLRRAIGEYFKAAFSGIWVHTHEPDEAVADIRAMCLKNNTVCATWDVLDGIAVLVPEGENAEAKGTDILPTLKAALALKPPDGALVLIVRNFHRVVSPVSPGKEAAAIVRAVEKFLVNGKTERVFLVALAPVVQIPIELEKLFVVVEHQLPGHDQLLKIAETVRDRGDLRDEDRDRVIDAAAGLTRMEAENAFSLSIVRHDRIVPEVVWELKSAMVRKSGLATVHRGGETFADLGGLDAMKSFCSRSLATNHPNPIARPRGILVLGVPGTGKSAFAKALGNETGRPTVVLDIGSLMGSLVGQTEANIRRALQIADAMSPCVLFCDEIEKGLAGGATGGQGDSGTATRLFGTLLTWLNDHETDVFFVATSNDISKLPPEFSRAERFDGVFFVDLPGPAERSRIWDLYEGKFEVGRVSAGDRRIAERPDDTGWTGAEIRACCRLSAMLGVSLREAAVNVVPVSKTAFEKVAGLREWAGGRCLDANLAGIYHQDRGAAPAADSPRRSLDRKK